METLAKMVNRRCEPLLRRGRRNCPVRQRSKKSKVEERAELSLSRAELKDQVEVMEARWGERASEKVDK